VHSQQKPYPRLPSLREVAALYTDNIKKPAKWLDCVLREAHLILITLSDTDFGGFF